MFAFALSMRSSWVMLCSLPLTGFIATIALALLLPKPIPIQASLGQLRLAVFLLTLTAIIFRSEVAILLLSHTTYIVLKQITRYGRLIHGVTVLNTAIIPAGISGAFIALCMTIPVDTFFWQSPTYLWPEMSAFLANIFPSNNGLGASAWGTQPWHWYFSSALLRILMRPFTYLLLWMFAISTTAISEPALDSLLPNLAYIAFYSLLPHKETRFIFPVIPPLTLAAALSTSYIWTRRHRKFLYRLLSIFLAISTVASSLVAHCVLLPLSALSYPGAHALNALHNHASSIQTPQEITGKTDPAMLVHLDNLSTQTGITRFLQHPSSSKVGARHWIYDKSDNATALLNPSWWEQFDYAIMGSPQLAIGSWDVITTIYGLGSFRILRPAERRKERHPMTGGKKEEFDGDGLDMIASRIYGPAGLWLSGTTREWLREGRGTQWMLGNEWSWTRGWWVDVEWVPKLYVLKRRESLAKEEAEQISHNN